MYLCEKTSVLGLLSLSTWINYANKSVGPSEMGRDVCGGGGIDRVNFVLICVSMCTAHCYLDLCIFMYYSNVLSVFYFFIFREAEQTKICFHFSTSKHCALSVEKLAPPRLSPRLK